MDRGAWWATNPLPWGCKELDTTERLSTRGGKSRTPRPWLSSPVSAASVPCSPCSSSQVRRPHHSAPCCSPRPLAPAAGHHLRLLLVPTFCVVPRDGPWRLGSRVSIPGTSLASQLALRAPAVIVDSSCYRYRVGLSFLLDQGSVGTDTVLSLPPQALEQCRHQIPAC